MHISRRHTKRNIWVTVSIHIHIGFHDTATGEIYELKAQLNSDRRDKKRDAIKKVIANMTVGKDVRYEQACTGQL